MSQPLHRGDLPQIVLDGRRAGELLGDFGEAVWWITRDMHPGPRAQHFDPDDPGGWTYEPIEHPDGSIEVVAVPQDSTGEQAVASDPTALAYLHYRRLIRSYRDAARTLCKFIDDHRPDRLTPQQDDPQDWCRSHLRIGVCEPRYRGDLCRWCYDFNLVYRQEPPQQLVKARHEGRRITDVMVTKALKARAQDARR